MLLPRSHIARFMVWEFYRSWTLPLLIGGSVFCVLYSGVLAVGTDLTERKINLFVASALMLLHGGYLLLMAYHLVFRHPIQPARPEASAYFLIFIGYFAHAIHVDVVSTGAFAITYAILVIVHIRHARHDEKGKEEDRPNQQARANWMFVTDWTACVLTTVMTLSALNLEEWKHPLFAVAWNGFFDVFYEAPKAALISLIRDWAATMPGTLRAVLAGIYHQASEKDVVILGALSAYLVIKGIVHRKRSHDKAAFYNGVKAAQRLDENQRIDWEAFRASLPTGNPRWIDVGSGSGSDLQQLIDQLGFAPKDSRRPGIIHFLDKDEKALARLDPAKHGRFANCLVWKLPVRLESREAREWVAQCRVIHLAHLAYRPTVARAVGRLLRHAPDDACLILRFTSDATYYRAISATMSCAPFLPYTYHAVHPLLLRDLHAAGWRKTRDDHILKCRANISPRHRPALVKWCDAAYGEFSGDVVKRYLDGLYGSHEDSVPNCDWLMVLKKGGAPAEVRLNVLTGRDVENIRHWPDYPDEVHKLSYALREGGWLDAHPEGRTVCRFAIRQDERLVGFALLTHIEAGQAEFYIAVHADCTGGGIGRKATLLVLRHAFEKLNLARVYLKVRDWHEDAQRCYERCGFTRTGGKFNEPVNGKPVDFFTMECHRPAPPPAPPPLS